MELKELFELVNLGQLSVSGLLSVAVAILYKLYKAETKINAKLNEEIRINAKETEDLMRKQTEALNTAAISLLTSKSQTSNSDANNKN